MMQAGPLAALGDVGLDDPVLALIRSGQATTRADLTQRTGMSRSAVAGRVDALLRTGIVRVAGAESSTGGRPAAILEFDRTAGAVLAVDLGATHAHAALVDLGGRVVADQFSAWDIASGPEATLAHLLEVVGTLRDTVGDALGPVIGIGMGLPGPVEFATGRPVRPPIMPGWDGYPVREALEGAFGAPAWVDNDVNIAALGEWSTRTPRPSDFVYVKVATGIGAGIISNGRLTRGAQGSAGDIGHIPIPQGLELPCACGNTGCLEAVAGGRAIVQRLNAQGLGVHSLDDVVQGARGSAPEAMVAVREAGRAIGHVLAGVVSTVNPEIIVIGGTLAESGDALLAGIREVIYQRCPPLATRELSIQSGDGRIPAALVGAATLALESWSGRPSVPVSAAS